jgi:hypothetical protein
MLFVLYHTARGECKKTKGEAKGENDEKGQKSG